MHKNQRAVVTGQRRADVARLYLTGIPQSEIARQLDCNQATVSRDLSALRTEWLQSALRDFDAHRAQELARIDEVEREAWDGWRGSREDAITLMEEEGGKDGGRTRRTVVGQAGDPRFLDQVQKCIQQRRELLGLDAPKRTEVSGPAGGPIGLARQLSDEELMEIIQRHGESDGLGSHDRIAPQEAGSPEPA